MSQPRGFRDGKSVYTNIAKQIDVNLNFIVDSTNGNGLGIRSLKSNGYVQSVFMHTTSTPAAGSPNPIAGYAVITFTNNFNVYLGGYEGSVAPLASSALTSVVASEPFVITSLGTTTLAQWQAAGLPHGLIPAVGQSFIAIASAAIGGTGTVGAPGVPTIIETSVVGDPNASIANHNIAANGGAEIIVQFLAATSSSVTTLAPAAPADGSVIGLMFRFDGSSVSVDGL